MKICIIAEGSYPYVSGGVSSWINSLMTSMPDKEFVIYAIAADQSYKGKYKYTFPANLVEIHEVFLDTHLRETSNWARRYNLTSEEKINLLALINGNAKVNWEELFKLLKSDRFENVSEFLASKDYFDLISELAKTDYAEVPFTSLYWTVSSMILPLFLIVREDIPEADVYHTVSTGYAGVVGALAKALKKKPVILTEHGIYSREREEEIIKADWVIGYFKDLWINYFYTLSSAIYDLSDEVITLFNKNKEIEVDLGCPPDKIRIIPNGIEVNDYTNAIRTYQDSKIRIGAIVRVVPIKDIKMMIQAFAIVVEQMPEAELYILGPYEENLSYYEECLNLVNSLNVKNVVFTGLVNISTYIGNLDILLLTSISEGQPLAILEGFACKKPFIATNVGSCRELIEGLNDEFGPAGFIVPVMHYEEMANRILYLAKNPNLMKTMGENGFKRVKAYYQKDKVISDYRSIYDTIGGKK
jgi:polysaccharide biosynthesis protein PelF